MILQLDAVYLHPKLVQFQNVVRRRKVQKCPKCPANVVTFQHHPHQKLVGLNHWNVCHVKNRRFDHNHPKCTELLKNLNSDFHKQASDEKKPATVKRSNTTLSRPTYQRAQSPSPDPKPPVQHNLRFFGDTDLESLSKASSKAGRKRTVLIPNNSHSLQNLRSNRTQMRTVESDGSRNVRNAASMQNLNSVSSNFIR